MLRNADGGGGVKFSGKWPRCQSLGVVATRAYRCRRGIGIGRFPWRSLPVHIAICCVKPPAGFSDSNQQRRAPLHCAMAAPSVEDGNVYKLIKIIPWRWAYIEWVLFFYKICIDSYDIYLLECFSLPLKLDTRPTHSEIVFFPTRGLQLKNGMLYRQT